MRARGREQPGRVRRGSSELAGQVVSAAVRDSQAHEQAELGPTASICVSARIFPSSNSLSRTKSETPYRRRRLANGRPRLDRMHVMDCGVRKHLTNKRNLGGRSAVEVADATSPQRAQHARLGVALDGVECRPSELVDKGPSGRCDHIRTQAMHRFVWLLGEDDNVDARRLRGVVETATDRRYGGLGQDLGHLRKSLAAYAIACALGRSQTNALFFGWRRLRPSATNVER